MSSKFMPAWILTTWDAGQYVWVMAPVMRAQQIHAGARVCVSPSPPPQCTIEHSRDLARCTGQCFAAALA